MYNNYIYIILVIAFFVIMMCNCKKNIENMTNLPTIVTETPTNTPIANYEYIGKLVHFYTRENAVFLTEGKWTSEYFKSIGVDNIEIISIPPGTNFYLETFEPVCPKCENVYNIKVPHDQTTYYTIILDINFKLKINNIKNISIKSL